MSLADPQLRVLYVGTLAPQGAGATLCCSELLAGLSSIGHGVRALRPATQEEANQPDLVARANPSIQVERYTVPFLEQDPYHQASEEFREIQRERIIEALQEMIDREPADVLLIGRESFVWHLPEFARNCSVPCVVMAHGVVLAILEGIFPPKLGQELLAQCRRANLVVACAEHMACGLQNLGFENTRVIPNGIDSTRFVPGTRNGRLADKLDIGIGDTVVLHASHLHDWKRPLDLVYSARKALQHNQTLLYLIVGDGPEKQSMESACHRLNVRDRFRFAGWIEYSAMPDYMLLADIVVMPSDFEGMARVYLEAQACGRALLASDIPAASEVVEDGLTGMLFRRGDVNELAKKTAILASDPIQRQTLGENARKQIEERHTLSQIAAEYSQTLSCVACS